MGVRVPTEKLEMKGGPVPATPSSLFPLPSSLFPLPSSLLLGVQLDDQLLLRRDRNVPAARTLEHAPAERVAIDGDPGERRAARRILHRRDHRHLFARGAAHRHFFARPNEIARNVDLLPVHVDVPVANQLPRRLAARRESHPVHHVVQPALEGGEKVVSRDARQLGDALERVAELALAHAVDALHLLLLAQLLRVFGRFPATRSGLSVLARRVRAALDGALLGGALVALKEQLGPFATALATTGSGVTHRSDPPALRRTAAVVRNRRHILDGADLQAGGGERLDGGFAARTGALHAHVHALDPHA